jgi:hypothetical protein
MRVYGCQACTYKVVLVPFSLVPSDTEKRRVRDVPTSAALSLR